MKTLIAVPCMDMVPTMFCQSMMHMERVGEVSVCFKANSLIYDSRNLLSLYAIENHFDRVLWLDSDMTFSQHAMKILMRDMDDMNADMVTSIYFKRKPPYSPVIFDALDEPAPDENGNLVARVHDYNDYPHDQVFPVRGCGFGCCLTSVQLLKDVWDKFGPAFSPYPWGGEDISFCHRVNLLGMKILCDSRVACGHIGQYVYTEDFHNEYMKRGE